MSKIYCTKCGIRGDSKCPHCRSIFPDQMPIANEVLDNTIKIRTVHRKNGDGSIAVFPDDAPKDLAGKQIKHIEVYFESWEETYEAAIRRTLKSLKAILSDEELNIDVASCVHDWKLMPGAESSIGCGHVGAANDNVPADPFATK